MRGGPYGLVARRVGKGQLALRYDRFSTLEPVSIEAFKTEDDGHALTLAYRIDWTKRLHGALEVIDIRSTNTTRAALGQPLSLRERQWQLSLRYRWHAAR